MTIIPARRTHAAAALAVAAALALAGCGGGGGEPDETGTTAPSPTASPSGPSESPSASPTGTPGGPPSATPPGTADDGSENPPPFPANTEPDTGEAQGGAVGTLTDIRLGGHEGFDRVVFELTGPGTPAWNVRYVDEAVHDASGQRVEVDGDAILEVTLVGVAIPEEGQAFYDGPDVLEVAGTEQVEQVVYTSLFEGYLQAFIGVDDGEQPFRVYRLEDPARVVVEVRDS
jgi:hypothetical protein